MTTNTAKITAAGYICFDGPSGLIQGSGNTAEAAEADARTTLARANIRIVQDDDPEAATSQVESDLDTLPATAALIAALGDSGWREVGGVACTLDEKCFGTDQPVAAGYAAVQEELAIFGVGATEDAALQDAEEWVDKNEDGEPNTGGLDTKPCSQALIDLVKTDGAPSVWGVVDGVLCTQAQEEAWA